MRTLLTTLLLFVAFYAAAQVQNTYTVASIAAMKSYYGTATRIHVAATGEDFIFCNTCTADEATVFAGVGIRKWKKFAPSVASDRITGAGTANKILLSDSTGKATWQATALYNLTNLQNWDKLRYNSILNRWENYRTTNSAGASLKMLVKDTVTGQEYHQEIPVSGGSSSVDSIRTSAIAPATGNIYINTVDNSLWFKSGGYWYKTAKADSVLAQVVNPPGYLTWAYKGAALSVVSNGLQNTNATAGQYQYARSNEMIAPGQSFTFQDNNVNVGSLKDRMIGLGTTATPAALNSIQYGMYLYVSGNIYKAESGAFGAPTTIGSYAANDILRINYNIDGSVDYQKSSNGTTWTTLRTVSGVIGSFYVIVALESTASLKEIKK